MDQSTEIWGELVISNPDIAILQDSQLSKTNIPMTDSKFLIGRSKDCHLQLGLKWISAHHCFISRLENGRVILNDTSTNGTYINKDLRVSHGQSHEINDNDKLYFILKRKDPQNDIFLTFHSKLDNVCSTETSQNTTEPALKKVKLEPLDIPLTDNEQEKTQIIKSEIPDSIENNEPVVDNLTPGPTSINSNPSTSSVENDSKDKPSSQASKDILEEALQCSLCLEILYDPISLQPCMHCYCSGCYSQWMDQSTNCPQCRSHVDALTRNKFINNMVEAYLKLNPGKKKSELDIQKQKMNDKITGDSMSFPAATTAGVSGTSCANALPGLPAHSWSVSVCGCSAHLPNLTLNCGKNPIPVSTSTTQWQPSDGVYTCDQCPAKAKPKPKAKNVPNLNGFTCSSNQKHIVCFCCDKPLPDRREEHNLDPTVPPQECFLCKKVFCSMYWICTRPGCIGCLTKFEDFNIQSHEMLNVLNNNVVESNILMDYLILNNMGWQNVLQECMQNLLNGGHQFNIPLTPSTILCHDCASQNFKSLVYKYREDIPTNNLPVTVTSKPNCYWGKKCRTQIHKFSHAQKYNHICEQTRF